MPTIHLITPWKLKDANIQALEQDYLKRLSSLKVHLHELKNEKDIAKKLDSLSPCYPITLEEKGEQMTSPRFSQWMMEKLDESHTPVFIFGGASGHEDEILQRSKLSLSLGKLTYPHQLARLLFVEQIYRAVCIHQGHPYHK